MQVVFEFKSTGKWRWVLLLLMFFQRFSSILWICQFSTLPRSITCFGGLSSVSWIAIYALVLSRSCSIGICASLCSSGNCSIINVPNNCRTITSRVVSTFTLQRLLCVRSKSANIEVNLAELYKGG